MIKIQVTEQFDSSLFLMIFDDDENSGDWTVQYIELL